MKLISGGGAEVEIKMHKVMGESHPALMLVTAILLIKKSNFTVCVSLCILMAGGFPSTSLL